MIYQYVLLKFVHNSQFHDPKNVSYNPQNQRQSNFNNIIILYIYNNIYLIYLYLNEYIIYEEDTDM